MNKFYLLIIIIIAAIGSFILLKDQGSNSNHFDEFAKCLAKKEITMYGANWCPYCQNEKKAFGNSFRFVPYIECPKDPKPCLTAGITGYPTWIFPNGKKLVGEQGLEKLSMESGCPLPKLN